MTKPILYFIEGEAPTNEEFEKASKFMNNGPILEFVSVPTLDLNADLLPHSEVAGAVPKPYQTVVTPVIEKAKK